AAHVKVASGAKVTTAAAHGLVGTWVIDPQDLTVAASGGDETGAQLGTALDSTNVQLESSAGANSGSGNVNIDDTVTWSANTTLTLTASNDVDVNASVTATGAGTGLVINPNTVNGAETASGTGTFNLAPGASINLPNVSASSTSALIIGGQAYTVINSLGAAGSTTGADLQGINGNPSGYYALGSDIDASATASWNGGAGFTPIGNSSTPFTGTLNGLGHTIAGLTIQLPGSDDVGLFGFSSGAIQSVGLTGAAVTGGAYSVGGLVGLNHGAISNSYVTGIVTASLNSTGGLAGRNYGTISGSHMDGTVNAVDNVGGLAGLNSGTIIDSYATGRVTGDYDVGGLVGDSSSGTIDDSYATSTAQGINNIGGLVGYNRQTIEYSYSTGSATASGSNVGGLLGANYGTVSNSFWNETTSGMTSSHGGTGLTTAQMQTAANFIGFNFTATPG
ncbi:MAG: beta strand repeat-containing protein, partial [Trebonia sp.]